MTEREVNTLCVLGIIGSLEIFAFTILMMLRGL